MVGLAELGAIGVVAPSNSNFPNFIDGNCNTGVVTATGQYSNDLEQQNSCLADEREGCRRELNSINSSISHLGRPRLAP